MKATVKWLEDSGWNAWIGDEHFTSFGITAICQKVESMMPTKECHWESKDGKLICHEGPFPGIRKLSKKDQ